MARYKLVKDEDLNTTGVVVNDDTHPTLPEGASIPNCVGNRDWDEYVLWEAEEGNTADAADTVDYMARMRSVRDQLLSRCDWTQITDSPLSGDAKTNYQTYRQDLRDMPQDNPNITTKEGYDGLTWPTEPSSSSSSSSSGA